MMGGGGDCRNEGSSCDGIVQSQHDNFDKTEQCTPAQWMNSAIRIKVDVQ